MNLYKITLTAWGLIISIIIISFIVFVNQSSEPSADVNPSPKPDHDPKILLQDCQLTDHDPTSGTSSNLTSSDGSIRIWTRGILKLTVIEGGDMYLVANFGILEVEEFGETNRIFRLKSKCMTMEISRSFASYKTVISLTDIGLNDKIDFRSAQSAPDEVEPEPDNRIILNKNMHFNQEIQIYAPIYIELLNKL